MSREGYAGWSLLPLLLLAYEIRYATPRLRDEIIYYDITEIRAKDTLRYCRRCCHTLRLASHCYTLSFSSFRHQSASRLRATSPLYAGRHYAMLRRFADAIRAAMRHAAAVTPRIIRYRDITIITPRFH